MSPASTFRQAVPPEQREIYPYHELVKFMQVPPAGSSEPVTSLDTDSTGAIHPASSIDNTTGSALQHDLSAIGRGTDTISPSALPLRQSPRGKEPENQGLGNEHIRRTTSPIRRLMDPAPAPFNGAGASVTTKQPYARPSFPVKAVAPHHIITQFLQIPPDQLQVLEAAKLRLSHSSLTAAGSSNTAPSSVATTSHSTAAPSSVAATSQAPAATRKEWHGFW